MYHIKNDKRAQTSARLISDGLIKCLRKKEFSKITITDIHKESYVGRATFYRLFDSLLDVLVYQCDQVFAEATQKLKQAPSKSAKERFILFVEQWMQNELLLETIISSNLISILYETHRRHFNELQEYFFHDVNLTEEKIDYLNVVGTATMVGSLAVWVQHGKQETAVQLFHNVKNSFIILLKQYL